MNELISAQKSQLRKRCRALRDALDREQRAQANALICKRLAGWDIFQRSETILTYMPIKSEADLTPLLELYPNKKWVLPRIIPEQDNLMVFHPYVADRLIRHAFGMAEPAHDLPTIQPAAIELVLAPGLAFDRHGWRLGYGGGYFDRFLKKFTGVSAGIVFHDLLLDEAPHGEHDMPMRWLVTERELFQAAA